MLRRDDAKQKPQASGNAPRLSQRGPGKETRKINNVEPVCQVPLLPAQAK
jgi:hypothetical protein